VNNLSQANNAGLIGSFPSTNAGAPATGTNPPAWSATFSGSTVTVYALCVPN
jgi:hypothetical protein